MSRVKLAWQMYPYTFLIGSIREYVLAHAMIPSNLHWARDWDCVACHDVTHL